MLKIYDVALEVVTELGPVIDLIKRKNRNLGDQLDRAVVAVPLAIAEGAYVRGGNRNVAYQRGISEMRESIACCDVAAARGYARVPAATLAKMRRVVGTLVNVVR